MKYVTYRIRGAIEESVIPSILSACAAVPGVRRVNITPTDELDVELALWLVQEPMEAQEQQLSDILAAKGLSLVLDSRTVTDADVPKPAERTSRTVTLTGAVASVITAVILAVLLTFSLTTNYLGGNPAPPVPDDKEEASVFDQMSMLDKIFRDMGVTELDENFGTALLKAYVDATGDTYAEYFTAEELEALKSDQKGEMCGIGMSVVNSTCTVGGVTYQAIAVANVYPDSPAEAAGVLPGDYIMYVGIGEDRVAINDIGYTDALNRMSGEEGTTCSFVAYRFKGTDGAYDEVEISAVRQKMTTRSVTGRTYGPDPAVGIIKITGFDDTTAPQFTETVENLKSLGCTSFVLDLRGNPGGLLSSVEDMLVYFLNEGDTIISTKDSKGYESTTKLKVNDDGKVQCGTRTLTRADVGKYRDLRFTVLVNGYSASAAELFTANMRDYELATIVGVKTFGKGSMQSTIPLSQYGYEGALKLTTNYYYPPSGEGYHGIGITPDVVVELDGSLAGININLLTDEQDNQLAAAVQSLKPAA